jgi:hypothetical protein
MPATFSVVTPAECPVRAHPGAMLLSVGATSVAMPFALECDPGARAFVRLRQPSYFLFAWPRARRMRARTAKLARGAQGRMPGVKRKTTKEKSHPAWRLPGIGQPLLRCLNFGHPCPRHGRQVREPELGFSTAHPCAGEKVSASGNCSCVASTPASMPSPCRCPLRGLSTPTHRRTAAPGRAAGHPGTHFSEGPEQNRQCAGRYPLYLTSSASFGSCALVVSPTHR